MCLTAAASQISILSAIATNRRFLVIFFCGDSQATISRQRLVADSTNWIEDKTALEKKKTKVHLTLFLHLLTNLTSIQVAKTKRIRSSPPNWCNMQT